MCVSPAWKLWLHLWLWCTSCWLRPSSPCGSTQTCCLALGATPSPWTPRPSFLLWEFCPRPRCCLWDGRQAGAQGPATQVRLGERPPNPNPSPTSDGCWCVGPCSGFRGLSSGYSWDMVHVMERMCRPLHNPVSFPVRAALLAQSFPQLHWLLQQSDR